jgi:hypothetical protein
MSPLTTMMMMKQRVDWYQYKLNLRVVLEERRLPLVEDAHVLLAASKQRLDDV